MRASSTKFSLLSLLGTTDSAGGLANPSNIQIKYQTSRNTVLNKTLSREIQCHCLEILIEFFLFGIPVKIYINPPRKTKKLSYAENERMGERNDV